MTRAQPARRLAAAVAGAAIALTGCVESDVVQRQPDAPDDGFQATGLLDGRRVAISRGEPAVVLGDCDANDGVDEDLCVRVRSIDGVTLNLVVENPGALVPGERLEVRADPCGQCDDVDSHAVVRLRLADRTIEVEAGHLTPSQVDERIAAAFDLRLRGGDRLTGSFNVLTGRAGP